MTVDLSSDWQNHVGCRVRLRLHCDWAKQQKARTDVDRPYHPPQEFQARQTWKTDQEHQG